MSKTNCVNCGHGKDPDAIKCPFCGTTYLDFTSIDIESHEPCVLSLKIGGSIFTMKAIPCISEVTIRPEPVTFNFGDNMSNTLSFLRSNEISCKVEFQSVGN